MTIFISHSSQDARLAERLVKLLRLAFSLSDAEIRCTSVDGYRLAAGADTNDQLRREVRESRLFLALITPSSVRSSYVLFELGARWGIDRLCFPCLRAELTPLRWTGRSKYLMPSICAADQSPTAPSRHWSPACEATCFSFCHRQRHSGSNRGGQSGLHGKFRQDKTGAGRSARGSGRGS